MMLWRSFLGWQQRVFYGWWIVAAGGALGSLNSGFYYYGFGAFFTPIISEFGWSRAALSGAFSIARFEAGILAPVAGMLIDRLGPRRIVAGGVLLIGVGYLLLSRVEDLFWFYAIFILVSIGQSFGTSMPAMAAVSNWFVRRRGLALGLMMAVFGVGGAVGLPILGWLITEHGWRMAAVVVGIAFWAVGLPASRLMRHRPEDQGLLPDGDPARPVSPQPDVGASPEPLIEVAFSPRQALKASAFWILSVSFAIRQMLSSAVAVHEVAFLVDRGYDLEEASALLGTTVLSSVFGRLFWGWLGDRWDRRRVLVLCHTLLSFGVFIMASIPDAQSPERVALFILVFGIGYGGTIPVSLALVADYFGRRSYGTIQGLSSVVTMFGNIIGPTLAGYVFDVSQSYVMALTFFGIATLLGLPLFWLVRRPVLAVLSPSAAQPSTTG